MKYWGRCLLVYLTITAVLYGTNSVAPDQVRAPAVTGGGAVGGKEKPPIGSKTSYAPWE